MSSTIQLSLHKHAGKKIAVFSHERSGTHFLMNSIAVNFDYISNPWFNFDNELNLNFHSADELQGFLSQLRSKPVANILKSHHPFEFLSPVIDELCNEFKVFYIIRDPRDAIISNWKLINSLGWDEGPRGTTVSEFIFNPPSGRMMRYQKHNEESMLSRWKTHVSGWMSFIENDPAQRAMAIRYEDLNISFDTVLPRISEYLELPLKQIIRPNREANVIGVGAGTKGGYTSYLNQEENNRILELIGDALQEYGYT